MLIFMPGQEDIETTCDLLSGKYFFFIFHVSYMSASAEMENLPCSEFEFIDI